MTHEVVAKRMQKKVFGIVTGILWGAEEHEELLSISNDKEQ